MVDKIKIFSKKISQNNLDEAEKWNWRNTKRKIYISSKKAANYWAIKATIIYK